MNHFKHPLCNTTIGPAKGDEDSVDVLHIQEGSFHGMRCRRSFWQPSAQELRCLAQGGPVVITMLGMSHPPITLEAINPEQGVDDTFVHDEQILQDLTSEYTEKFGTYYAPTMDALHDMMKSYAMQMLRRYGK